MDQIQDGYNIEKVEVEDLPDGVEASNFEQGIWLVTLYGKPKAYCASEGFAQLITRNNLARTSVEFGEPLWFDIIQDGAFRASCLAMTRSLVLDYFLSERP